MLSAGSSLSLWWTGCSTGEQRLGPPPNPAPRASSGLRQGEQAWGNTAEQFFIEINRGGRAKGVLRASGVKPPPFLHPSGPGGHRSDPETLLCSGFVFRHAPWAAGGVRNFWITIFL